MPEKSGVLLGQETEVTFRSPGNYRFFGTRNETVPAGTKVDSFLLHFRSTDGELVRGVIKFDRPMIGLICEANQLANTDPDGFFKLGHRKDHWWLITPEGKPFFTMGINHIDPASLRYPENLGIWREKYGGSTIRWIEESVAPYLKSWGFNTVGWVQEVTVRGAAGGWQHSRAFIKEIED